MPQALLADVCTPRKHISITERLKLTFDSLVTEQAVSLSEHKDRDVQEGTEIKGCGSPRASQRNVKVVTEEG